MKPRRLQRLVLTAGLLAIPAIVLAVTHTSQISTNMENYRVCADPPLGTCMYDDIRSPSEFYIPDGNKVSVYLKSDGKVDIKSDALAIDSNLSFACSSENYPCNGDSPTHHCSAGPRTNSNCTWNICVGGTNDGGSCSAGGPSACPGGFCSGTQCSAFTCQGGPLDDKECLSASTDCNDFEGYNAQVSSGWNVLFRGNTQALVFEYVGGVLYNLDELQGGTAPANPNMGDGCLMKCPFSVNNSGSNSANITCSTEGDCSSVKQFNSIEILDPQGHTMAVPTLGTATITRASGYIGTIGDTGDPAKYGDACRTQNPPPDDCN